MPDSRQTLEVSGFRFVSNFVHGEQQERAAGGTLRDSLIISTSKSYTKSNRRALKVTLLIDLFLKAKLLKIMQSKSFLRSFPKISLALHR